jgi:hypothetical protein
VDDEPRPPETADDELGVDRSQIREMLALTPVERVRKLESFESVLEIRNLNAGRPELEPPRPRAA